MNDAVTISLGLCMAMLVQTGVIAFWAGRMTQRLAAVEKTAGDGASTNDKVTRLVVEMEHANAGLDRLGHQMEGVQQQLASMARDTRP